MEINRYLDFKHKYQLILDLVVWLWWSLALLFIGDVIKTHFSSTLPYVIKSPEPIRIAVFFLCLVVLVILTKEFFKFVLINFRKNNTYVFNSEDWPNKWIFNGKTELFDDTYLFVKSSRAGCLLRDNYWKDFRMSFEMRFLNIKDPKILDYQKRIGLVFRAEDLDNYFMIEIGQGVEGSIDSSVKPHVRYKGGWEIMSVEESKISFDFSSFNKVTLEVKNDVVHLFYKNISIFYWVLPTHVDVNHIESGVKDENKDGQEDKQMKNITGKIFAGHVQDIPFRLSYGLVGFRAYMKHGAIIRSLRIEPI